MREKSLRLRLLSKRTLVWILVVLVLLSPFIVTFMPFGKGSGEKPKPTELMAKATVLANMSLTQLSRALSLLEPNTSKTWVIASQAFSVSRDLMEAANEVSVNKGFSAAMKKAMESYALLANESAESTLAVPELYEGLLKTAEALGLAENCRIDEALKTYEEAKPLLTNARERLSEALGYGSSIDTSALLSLQHKEIAENLTNKVAEALSMLNEINRFFNFLAQNNDTVKKLCTGEKPSPQEAENLVKGIKSLRPEKAGAMGYNEAVIIEQLLSKLGSLQQGGQEGPGASSGEQSGSQGGGHGAGYRAPSSDD
ncbi:hypothetical protein PYJP_02670 [Pyrofollis japonicus]|uniref:hypothetical protein n=1 Tax=Pyrofollis japonicus TaxID=3060460 RepID=UPI00295AEFF1|nr:hypothetical protein [Pyrofollis japonicus]BEP16915.1 hypothetical protein PYJP_02670 [Pyrofollis japonicus]